MAGGRIRWAGVAPGSGVSTGMFSLAECVLGGGVELYCRLLHERHKAQSLKSRYPFLIYVYAPLLLKCFERDEFANVPAVKVSGYTMNNR